jgi:hypothetical protein
MAKLQAANSSDNNFPEISELVFEDMIHSQFITAANCNVVAQRVQG